MVKNFFSPVLPNSLFENMHIQFSLSEVEALIRKNYNLPSGVPIKIVDESPIRQLPNYVEFIGLIQKTFGEEIPSYRKIEAIKYVRTILPGCGLADAKTFIEGWPRYKQWIEQYKQLPFTPDCKLFI